MPRPLTTRDQIARAVFDAEDLMTRVWDALGKHADEFRTDETMPTVRAKTAVSNLAHLLRRPIQDR